MQHSNKTTKLYAGINAGDIKLPKGTVSPRLARPLSNTQPAIGFGGITGEQKNQLKTWAEQRDAILAEITANTSVNDALIKKNRGLNDANSIATDRAMILKGNIEILEKTEKDRVALVSKELSDVLIKTNEAQKRLANINADIEKATEQKTKLSTDIAAAIVIHDRIFARASVLDQVVDRVTRINEENINKVNIMISELGKAVVNTKTSLLSISDGMTKHMSNLNDRIIKTSTQEGASAPEKNNVGKAHLESK